MSWFADWFNSPYYHILYKNRDNKEAQRFINNLVRYLKIKKESRIIDIACGIGRHAKYFNKLGFDVIGIDLAENNIAIAKKQENINLQFFKHDMRKSFKKDGFHIATNLFTSFGYFENETDNQKAINAMTENLKSEGILIIDFMNVKKVISKLVKSEKKALNGINFNIKRKIENDYIVKNISFSDKGENYMFEEKVKVITLDKFSNLITKARLKIIDIFGNYDLSAFNATNSERLILICKK